MSPQSIASVARQFLAIAGIVMGVITASVTSLHLPTAVSSILVVAGSVILAVEHYVSDPSTGTTTPATPVVVGNLGAPVIPAAPPAVPVTSA